MLDRMEQNLSILTEHQRQVYLLRQQNLTFVQIGARLGMSAANAGKLPTAACGMPQSCSMRRR